MGNDFQITSDLVDMIYNLTEGDEDLMRYHQEHGTPSMLVLTQYNQRIAKETLSTFSDRIKDKVVIEIGAGIGFLAMEMATVAEMVYAIEVDPSWSWVFTSCLYRYKPPNLTWIFGGAGTIAGLIKGDIAVIVTHSGHAELIELGYKFAPEVIMPLEGMTLYSEEA